MLHFEFGNKDDFSLSQQLDDKRSCLSDSPVSACNLIDCGCKGRQVTNSNSWVRHPPSTHSRFLNHPLTFVSFCNAGHLPFFNTTMQIH